jgi:hypothetical protein
MRINIVCKDGQTSVFNADTGDRILPHLVSVRFEHKSLYDEPTIHLTAWAKDVEIETDGIVPTIDKVDPLGKAACPRCGYTDKPPFLITRIEDESHRLQCQKCRHIYHLPVRPECVAP